MRAHLVALLVIVALAGVLTRPAPPPNRQRPVTVTVDGLRIGDPAATVLALWGRPDSVTPGELWTYAVSGRSALVDDGTVIMLTGRHLVTPLGGEICIGKPLPQRCPGLRRATTAYDEARRRIFRLDGQPGEVRVTTDEDGVVWRIYLTGTP